MYRIAEVFDRFPSASMLLVALLSCYPASMLLPASWGWENGVLEVGQVLVLLGGLGMALLAWRWLRPSSLALLALYAAPLWAVLVGRELSWGAVFGAPLAFTEHGPLFSSRHLWYKPLVLPAVGLALGVAAHALWHWRLDRLLLRLARERRIPWLVLSLAFVAEAGSSCAEGHLHCSFALRLPHAMVFEELVELVAYLALVVAQAGVFAGGAMSAPAVFRAPDTARGAP